MGQTRDVYITGCGAYLPGEPVDNEEMARRLGAAPGSAALRERVLAANGIRTRHYALDGDGTPVLLNEELAAEAVGRAVKDSGRDLTGIGMLATGTSMGDVLLPGFASMVHGRVGGGAMELLSAGGICASSMAAFKAATAAVRLGEHDAAAVVGSELVSRVLTENRYATGSRSTFDAEFLRWTLSDGAGAVVLASEPRPDRPSLRVEWVHAVSFAHEHPVCMGAGYPTNEAPRAGHTWLDTSSAAAAERAGMLRLRQNVRALPDLFREGLAEFVRLVGAGRLDPSTVDHVLCHYSARHFRADIFRLLREAGLMMDESRWFTNLHTCGNTGAASIFVMLEECWRGNRFRPGEQVLLIVPESGRFSFAFALLTCVEPTGTAPAVAEAVRVASPVGEVEGDPESVRWMVARLAQVWADLERRLGTVPLVRRIETGTATIEDYRALLLNLRQQVVEGGRWISRAASNFSAEQFELRSAAIRHAAEEHRDFQLLERDYVAVGGDLGTIRTAPKNPGAEALSAYVFHQASQPDPVDLLGAMFVIEGLGTARAAGWARQLSERLGLTDDQVSFLRYHGEHDDDHVGQLRALLRRVAEDRTQAERIVRTATVVARLYVMQLAEIDDER
jgi:3-oxoacyl-[acyl-carrier-protein] synthase III